MRKFTLSGNTIRDLSILLFLVMVFISSVLISQSPGDHQLEYQTMMILAYTAVLFGFFGYIYFCVVASGTLVVAWTAYKLYFFYSKGTNLIPEDYYWLIIPILLSASVIGFQYGTSNLEKENELLRNQVEDLVMIDPLTGLYNLRSFYHDWEQMVQYGARNNLNITLMIIRLRYGQELREILPRNRFDQVKQKLVEHVLDALRIEDEVYSIDDEGSLAVILTTDTEGSEIVRNRIRNNVQNPESFSGIIDKNIQVSLRIGFKQFDQKEIGTVTGMQFKQMVESELAYDV